MKSAFFWDFTGISHRGALLRIDISEEHIASIIRVKRFSEPETLVLRLVVSTNVVPSLPILVILKMAAIRSSETSVHKRATCRNIPEVGILHQEFCPNGSD
jgi:hypothetical protein